MTDLRVLALIGESGPEARRITEALREVDPACATVADLREATSVSESISPDIVVLDVAGSGVERAELELALAERLATPPPPVLALRDVSGAAAGESPSEDHYLYRPFASETLIALVGSLAGKYAVRQGNVDRSEAEHGQTTAVMRPHPVYEKARSYVASTFQDVRDGARPDIQGSRSVAEEIHTALLHSNALVRKVLEPHASFDLASHSVNVAVIAGRVSLGLSDPPGDVVSAIQGGLVHDIGMARLPEGLIGKAGTLTEDELAEVRRHPEYGYEIIEASGPGLEWLARVALQEHERANGQGYPLGLPSDSIDPVAELIAVADVFEALSHPRTYRSPYTTFDALEQVVGMQEEYFAPHVVSALVHEISSFPPDSYVQLSTGEICQVVSPNHENLMRPRVRVLWNADWQRLDEPHLVDLNAHPAITVSRSLLEAELPIG